MYLVSYCPGISGRKRITMKKLHSTNNVYQDLADAMFNPVASSGELTFQKLLECLEKFLEVLSPFKGDDMIDVPVSIIGKRGGKPVEMYLRWLGCPIELAVNNNDEEVVEFVDTFGYPARALIEMVKAMPEDYRKFPAYAGVSFEEGGATERYLLEGVDCSIDTDFPIGEKYTVYLPKITIRL